jgi:hypothetical protein
LRSFRIFESPLPQRLAGGVQQDGFVNSGRFSRRGQAEGGQDQFVDLAQNAFGGPDFDIDFTVVDFLEAL